jgi:NADH-quinone oxidoreductase subunit M
LTAGYILWAIQRVYLGPPKPEYANTPDITLREICVMAPLAVMSIALGVLPKQMVFTFTSGTLVHVLKLVS